MVKSIGWSRLLHPLSVTGPFTALPPPVSPQPFFWLYSIQVRSWLQTTPIEELNDALLGSPLKYSNDPGAWRNRADRVTVSPQMTLEAALAAGHDLAAEQQVAVLCCAVPCLAVPCRATQLTCLPGLNF